MTFKICSELAIVLIHPLTIPVIWKNGSFVLKTFHLYFHTHSWTYFIMVLRLVYTTRYFLLKSSLFGSTKVETVASLNKINTGGLTAENRRLIYRSYMNEFAGRIMAITTIVNLTLIAWLIRLAECNADDKNDYQNAVTSFPDCLWLTIITFTTIGYGDFYPVTAWGKIFAMTLGLTGCIFTAILVGLMTDKLAMTRRERLLHRVLNDDWMEKEMRDRAAIVLQRTFRCYRKGKKVLIQTLKC